MSASELYDALRDAQIMAFEMEAENERLWEEFMKLQRGDND